MNLINGAPLLTEAGVSALLGGIWKRRVSEYERSSLLFYVSTAHAWAG